MQKMKPRALRDNEQEKMDKEQNVDTMGKIKQGIRIGKSTIKTQ